MMETHLVLFSYFIVISTASPHKSFQASDGGKSRSIPAVDALITRLEAERWKPGDEPCVRATLDMLWGVKNNTLWAMWVWDAMQPPVGTFYGVQVHIGNYDQCLKAPWSSIEYDKNPALRTQYCIVDVETEAAEDNIQLGPFDAAELYFRTQTKYRRRLNKQFFGVCLPAVCSVSLVAKISRHLHQLTHLPDGQVYVDPRDCQKAGEIVEYSRGFYMFFSIVGILFATAVISTFFKSGGENHTFFDLITNSFCLKRNYNALFAVNRDEIKVMNGMRFITAALIVIIHDGVFAIVLPIANGVEVDKALNDPMGKAMSHLEVVVDTFLTMSGLLLIRGLMMGRQKNTLYTLVKRYIRLIGPLALCTLYLSSVVLYLDQGPIWLRANREETDICANNWWRNILMINSKLESLCHVMTWYVSCDFQLAILATFLFCLFRKNRKLGITAFVVVAVAVTLNLGLTVYWNKLKILPFDLVGTLQLRKNAVLDLIYFKSYVRAGPYLVGMVMGYIIAIYKPGDHRNVISKKWSLIMALMSLATMTTVISIGYFIDERPYNPLEAAVVVATNRAIWAVAICCLIGACEYGSVSLISDLLGWSGFVPLSKLTYGLYLLHSFIIQKEKFSTRSVATYGTLPMIINSLGVLVVGCGMSLILYLIVEAPLINISNALFTQKPKSSEKNSKNDSNNINSNIATLNQNGHTKAKIF